MDLHTDLPIGYTIICFFLSLVVVVFLYRKAQRFKDLSFVQRLVPAVLRALVVFVLAFFLLGPTLKYVDLKFEKPILLIANDISESLEQDSTNQKKWINTFKEQANFENLELKFVNFGSQVLLEDETIEGINQKTSFSELSNYVENNYEGRNLAGVVIASDGISNSGLNPIYSSMVQRTPLYTVGFGDTTQLQDARISNLQYNQLGRLNSKSPINFDIKTQGFKGQEVTAILYNGEQKLKEQKIRISSDNSFDKLRWELDLNQVGLEKFRVELRSKVMESNTQNNSETFFVDVQEVRKKVLLLAATPHPDIAAITASITDQFGIQVDVKMAYDGKPEIKDYQLIILHQLPHSGKSYPWISELVNANVGVWFILGSLTNLKELAMVQDWLEVETTKGNPDEVFPVLNTAFTSFQLDAEIANAFKVNKPLLKPFATYKVPSNAEVLLYQKIGSLVTPYPLLFAVNDGKRKFGFLLAEGIWLSRLGEQQQSGGTKSFDALLKKWVNYLAILEKKERLSVDVERRFLTSDGVSMSARYYNPSFELDDGVNVVVRIKSDLGKEFNYNFRPANNAFLMQTNGLPEGSYTYQVSVEGQSSISKKGAFIIVSNNLESQDLQANHGILRNLALKSGGGFYYPNQVSELISNIEESKATKVIQYEELVFKNLLDFYWLFYLLLGLLSAEWLWRKWLGMI